MAVYIAAVVIKVNSHQIGSCLLTAPLGFRDFDLTGVNGLISIGRIIEDWDGFDMIEI